MNSIDAFPRMVLAWLLLASFITPGFTFIVIPG